MNWLVVKENESVEELQMFSSLCTSYMYLKNNHLFFYVKMVWGEWEKIDTRNGALNIL